MSGFNSFLGGVTAGQDAYQQRSQSAFNASMMAGDEGGVTAPRQRGENIDAAFGGGERGGVGPDLATVFVGLDPAKRQEVKADLSRKGQIIAALTPRPAEEQVIGINTFGKEWGIDAATRERAAANPAKALAEVSSSIQQAEAMLEQLGHDSRPRHVEDKAPIYSIPRGIGREERPVTLMAQVAERQSQALDPNGRQSSSPQIPAQKMDPMGPLVQDANRRFNPNNSNGAEPPYGVGENSKTANKTRGELFDIEKTIGKIARAAEGAYDGGYGEGYTYAQPQGRFGAKTNKCNLFVSDMIKAAGAKVPFNIDEETGIGWEPRAEQWASPDIPMEGWAVVDTPREGDVVAQKRSYRNDQASGHVGIVTRAADEQGYYRTISAGTEGVQEESSALSFPSFIQDIETGPVIFRRYVGTK